jgi:hypothetical protein
MNAEQDGHGQGRDLKEAFDKAWDKTDKNPNKWYRAEISVKGDNPITQYRVFLSG